MNINNKIEEDYCSPEVVNLLLKYGFNVDCPKPIPTHALAIKWIRWNFKIDISIHKSTSGKSVSEIWRINPEPNKGWIRERTEYGEETHYKATEKALLYVLNNMI